MLHDQAAFETALQEAIDLMEHPPQPGSPQDQRLQALLGEISCYTPPLEAEPDVVVNERQVFEEKLQAFEAQRRREEAGAFGRNYDGIGPTLGMDIGEKTAGEG